MFCAERGFDPLCVPIDTVLHFLTTLFNQGLGHSAINTARSALSAVLQPMGGKTVGSHPKIVRFMKGVFELRTPLPRHNNFWDVSILLKHLENQEDGELGLKDLTLKLCALMLLTSAQRLQTIHLIKASNILWHNSECTILLTDKLKSTHPGFDQKEIKFHKFQKNPKLCVIKCLKEYLERTEPLRRKHCDQLFLCYRPPHGAASKDTLARWMKSLLYKVGIQDFGPHSFRGASSSAMAKSGVPIDDILKSAGWSSAQTFQKFYNKPIGKKPVDNNSILNYYKKI